MARTHRNRLVLRQIAKVDALRLTPRGDYASCENRKAHDSDCVHLKVQHDQLWYLAFSLANRRHNDDRDLELDHTMCESSLADGRQ